MKGVKNDVIEITANKLYPYLSQVEFKNGLFWTKDKNKSSISQLYEDLYAGKAIDFDLCSGANPCFDMKSNYSITTKPSFIRKIQCPLASIGSVSFRDQISHKISSINE
jgi:hypothetical protein